MRMTLSQFIAFLLLVALPLLLARSSSRAAVACATDDLGNCMVDNPPGCTCPSSVPPGEGGYYYVNSGKTAGSVLINWPYNRTNGTEWTQQ